MRFGDIPVGDAVGAILGHSVHIGGMVLKKGALLSAGTVEQLAAAGIDTVFAARLGNDDVVEDAAAERLAAAIAGANVTVTPARTGRVNIHAAARGLALVDSARLMQLNKVSESITVATVTPYGVLDQGEMAATVKIIPFAVPSTVLDRVVSVAGDGEPIVALAPLVPRRVALIISVVKGSKVSLVRKSEKAIGDRVQALGSEIVHTAVVDHTVDAVSAAVLQAADVADIVLVFGGSAIVDRADVVPAAVGAAGGKVVHLGMPVDPGNLLMLGKLADLPVIGVPSCARSPKLNGFDWVLQRILAGIAVTGEDIMAMGAGGLLKEIPSRPAPRENPS